MASLFTDDVVFEIVVSAATLGEIPVEGRPAAARAAERIASDLEPEVYATTNLELAAAEGVRAGLRRGELRGLRCEDVDLEARVIHVRRSWDNKEGEIEPKSRKGVRRVPVTSELRLLLLEHLARTGRRDADLIFGRTSSEPFTPSRLRKRALGCWAIAAVGAFLTGSPLPVEIAPIGLHECRHTYVSLMHDAGFSLERIGDYAGHTSAYMTDRYRHLLQGHEQEAADILDAYLAKRTGVQGGARLAVASSGAGI